MLDETAMVQRRIAEHVELNKGVAYGQRLQDCGMMLNEPAMVQRRFAAHVKLGKDAAHLRRVIV